MRQLLPLFLAPSLFPVGSMAVAQDGDLAHVERPIERRLHFWAGEWDCYPAQGGPLNGRNDLILRSGGQVLHEMWSPVGGGPGGESWNYFLPSSGTWRQHWVGDSGPPFVFDGKAEGEGILFEGPWLDGLRTKNRKRMFLRPIGGGRVQQTGTQSTDGGTTWQPEFDLVYVPRGEPFAPGDAHEAAAPDPAREFDFLLGRWRMRVEQYDPEGNLLRTLDEESRVRSLIGGASLLDEWGSSGFTIRTYDPREKVWRFFWTDRDFLRGRMQSWEGTFDGGVGTFVGGQGLPVSTGAVTSRIEFSEIGEDSLLWKMWKSRDGGETWVLDYVRRYSRLE